MEARELFTSLPAIRVAAIYVIAFTLGTLDQIAALPLEQSLRLPLPRTENRKLSTSSSIVFVSLAFHARVAPPGTFPAPGADLRFGWYAAHRFELALV